MHRRLLVALASLTAACSSRAAPQAETFPPPTAATVVSRSTAAPEPMPPPTLPSPAAVPVTTVPPAAPSSEPPVTDPPVTEAPVTEALRVGWVGGSDVVLRDVSLPSLANDLALTVRGRPVVFEPYTKEAPSPLDTMELVTDALDAGADALIVTFNPQWLYGRVCEGVEPPHTRYACLLADGPVTGGDAIGGLVATLSNAPVPVVVTLLPTSADALASPELGPVIALANDRLAQRIPPAPNIEVVDESLTSGRPEFAEGVGFQDMVHPTRAGAALLSQLIVERLLVIEEQFADASSD